MDVLPFTKIIERKTFSDLDELIEAFPVFNPDFMYDFSQKNGKIDFEDFYSEVYWKKEGSKYFLDEKKTLDSLKATTFKIINDEGRIIHKESGYTNILLTAEAIKHQQGFVLGTFGKYFIDGFLENFPDSKAKYDLAVRDSHTSLYAKSQGMTHTELLRYRILGSVRGESRDIISYDDSSDLI